MNYPEFARGYRDTRHADAFSFVGREQLISPDLEEAFAPAREWSDYFGKLTMRHLFSAPIDPKVELPIMHSYIDWSIPSVQSLYKRTEEVVLENIDYGHYLSELNFHLAAPRMEEQWHKIIDPDYDPPESRIVDSQSWLATKAAEIARERKIRMSLEEKNGVRQGIVGLYNGQLTELDSLVVKLELEKRNQDLDLVVLPAPKRFESSFRSNRNADSLLLDRQRGYARGVQVKTRLATGDSDEVIAPNYDQRFVTFIDGFIDLGNSIDRKIPGTSSHRSSAWPGLISMDHLIRTPIRRMPAANDRDFKMMHLRSKQIAAELSRGRKDFIPIATQNISGRLLTDLYRS